MSDVVHVPQRGHSCGPNTRSGVWWDERGPLYDAPGTVRQCECGRTWVAERRTPGLAVPTWRREGLVRTLAARETGALPMKSDVKLVAKFLREQYGRSLSHIGSCTEIAEGFIEAVEEDGRLGDATPAAEDWAPSDDDVDAFAGAGVGGMVRLWRASEIAHYALIGLARAGRLLPAKEGIDG